MSAPRPPARTVWSISDGMGTSVAIKRAGIRHRIVALDSVPHGLSTAVALTVTVRDLRELHAALTDYLTQETPA